MSQQNESARFLWCQRCHGHGRLVLPPDDAWGEVFSKADAYEQLQALVRARRIPANRYPFLVGQIAHSALPAINPPDVDDFICRYWKDETWMACYSRSDWAELESVHVRIENDDLAVAVHEFLIHSPHRALGLQ